MDAREVLAWLERRGTKRNVEGLQRYGIVAKQAFGVPVRELRKLARQLGRDHALAAQLWKTGRYEARMLATMVDDPAQVTRQQMEAWAKDFDNWALCDTACFCLFDRSPLAWKQVRRWARSPREFSKRAAFALLASLAGHDKAAADEGFLALLPLCEETATDERNFVKKGVSWACAAWATAAPPCTPPSWRWPGAWPRPTRRPRAGWAGTPCATCSGRWSWPSSSARPGAS